MALGADRASVLRPVLGQGTLRLFLGTTASVAVGRFLSATLYATSPLEPITLAAATLLLAAIGVGAAFIPARCAAGRDPALALRAD